MKKIILPLIVAVGLGAACGTYADEAPAAAAAPASPFTFNIAATSDYVFRGVTQNGGKFAVQGGADYTKDIFYAGVWASNVNFASREIDLYAGIRPTLGKTAFDIGVIRYDYDNCKCNVTEVKAAASHPFGNHTVGLAIYGNTEIAQNTYVELNDTVSLGDKWTASAAYGEQKIKGGGSYGTGNFGVTYALTPHFSLDTRVSGTDYVLPKNGDVRLAVTLKATY